MIETTTNIKTEKQLIPALRFKEFEGEWNKDKLGNLSSNISYGIGAAATEFDGVNKYLRITDIDEDSREFKPNPLTSPEGGAGDKYKLKKGDIVFARTGASVGKSYLYKETDGNLIYAGFLIKFNINKADPRFIYALTFNESYDKWVHVFSMRSGQPGLNAEEYKGFKINLPSLPEQQKIASFLSAVDEKIQQLTKKKALLEQYKKGVMQQLFSGQLRFKDENGNLYPDWEDAILGDCLDYVQPTKFLVSSTEYDDSFETPVLTAGKTFILGYTNEKENICNDYPLIIFDDFTTATQYVDFPFKAKSSAMKLLISKEGIDIKFMYESMQNIKFEVGGHGRHWISIFSQLVMSIPSVKEQQKIATYLSGIDTKIESVNNQITQTQTFKKGLLQQMFV